ncbi:MAG TPA: alpha/beta fold hydrolase [Gaiellaceae bacterium]|nr:alpha/beta fold hydrolase [Gaiellaceae bacterium]
MRLHTYEWGDPGSPPVVCLHGVTGHGLRFRKLAEERLASRFHVVAADLRGHGHSSWDEPWDIATHVADLLETFDESAYWIGHSFGGRLIMQVAAVRPELVRRAVLLDPAILIPPPHSHQLAAEALQQESYGSVDEGIETRIARSGLAHTPREILEEEFANHAFVGDDGRLHLRYSAKAVSDGYLELGTPPPPFETLGVPTLVVVGALSVVVLAGQLELYRRALGNLITIEVVPGGHSVLWDAFDETAAAVDAFLEP